MLNNPQKSKQPKLSFSFLVWVILPQIFAPIIFFSVWFGFSELIGRIIPLANYEHFRAICNFIGFFPAISAIFIFSELKLLMRTKWR